MSRRAAPEAELQARMRALEARLAAEQPRRPFLVGQAPNSTGAGWPALSGASGRRIAELAGLVRPGAFHPAYWLLLASERENLLERWPGARGDGDDFPLPEAVLGARRILARLHGAGALEGRRLLLVGRHVARAFGLAHVPFYERARRAYAPALSHGERAGRPLLRLLEAGHAGAATFDAWTMPHPSGRSHYWNDPANRARASAFLREFFGQGLAPDAPAQGQMGLFEPAKGGPGCPGS